MNKRKYDDNNIFAKIIKGEAQAEIVYENKLVLCFKDIMPKAPVHILIIPKKNYRDIFDFSENSSEKEKLAIFQAFRDLVKKYKLEEKGNRIITNSGVYGRQEVPHLHFHLFGGEKVGKMVE